KTFAQNLLSIFGQESLQIGAIEETDDCRDNHGQRLRSKFAQTRCLRDSVRPIYPPIRKHERFENFSMTAHPQVPKLERPAVQEKIRGEFRFALFLKGVRHSPLRKDYQLAGESRGNHIGGFPMSTLGIDRRVRTV